MSTALPGLFPEEIAERLELPKFRGRQIFRWIHAKGATDFAGMTDLSKELRARLEADYAASTLDVADTRVSRASGTRKLLFRLADGETVEAVLLRDDDRLTLCVSSQVGCPLGCAFCATGAAGFVRDLTASEIVEQVLRLLQGEALGERTPNIVYMGMGEPFLNYEAVVRSIRLLMHAEGLGIGVRKITVSTVGEAEGIERFAGEDWQVRLSVSLHAANNALRSELVPLNRRYPLGRLHDAFEHYQDATGRRVTFEWVLLEGVNDSVGHAAELVDFARGLNVSVNLIPWNPAAGLPFRPPPPQRCQAFRDALLGAGIKTTLRREKGGDIEAACGQLRGIHNAPSSG